MPWKKIMACQNLCQAVPATAPSSLRGGMDSEQDRAPYLDALREYAARDPARLHVPAHKGGPGADAELLRAIGERALSLDIPALTHGIDLGPAPTPFEQAQRLAAKAWGARRTWFLINGASQGNIAAGLALAHHGDEVVLQRNVHSSTIDALVLSGMRPTFAAPEVDPQLGIAHCLTAAALERARSTPPVARRRCTGARCWGARSRCSSARGRRSAPSTGSTCSMSASRGGRACSRMTRCGSRSTCAGWPRAAISWRRC